MKTFDRPIIIVGTGRNGSKVLHQMLARHRRLSYLTGVLTHWPSRVGLNRMVVAARAWPVVGGFARRRIQAMEAFPFWESLVPGFSRPTRDLRAEDVTTNGKEEVQRAFSRLLTRGRSRLLIKLTGWTRIGYVKEIFPDARILHLIRSPYAVVSSWLHVFFWEGWRGPTQWRWGVLTPDEERLWQKHEQSFPVLAAIGYKHILDAYEASLGRLPEDRRKNVMEIHYSDLCAASEEVIGRILAFCEVEDDKAFRGALSEFRLASRDDKWRHELPPVEQQRLEGAVAELGLTHYVR